VNQPHELLAQASDYAGTIEGWRVWLAKRHSIRYFDPATESRRKLRGPYLLKSVTSEDWWRPQDPMSADCNITLGYRFDITHKDEDRLCPDSGCKCGIYAVESLSNLMEVYQTSNRLFYRLSVERYPAVVGLVKMWGKVIPGEWGWRAQFAYPSQLYIIDRFAGRFRSRHDRLLEDLRRYGVPVEFITPAELMEHTPLARAADKVIDLREAEESLPELDLHNG
jgi:hypothetical protein